MTALGINFTILLLVVAAYGQKALATPAYLVDKVEGIMVPHVEFKDTPLREALNFLQEKSVEHDVAEPDPTNRGINLILITGIGESELGESPVTLKLTNVSLSTALKHTVALAKMKCVVDSRAVIVVPLNWKDQRESGAEAASVTKGIIVPSVEFENTPLRAALEHFRKISKELDLDKEGVRIILKPDSSLAGGDVRITMKLGNIPLSEALRYTAALAGMKLSYEADSIIMVPMAGKKKD